ncbi:MAG: TIGR02680 family protein [Candidatus Gastranaerophilales bacterium]|nr:TIGR02680 family protein [Candidatus Gastranaerophilales bacterium]
MNSEWQINRIGMLDFWYYDEQEFEFLDGRMLLRGANGSGKSVTMQSFIPLLLDGNMRPERLDPFGSRARKMENYLLEEGDEREERTGYLYMELKRIDSDSYTTIGMGIRARKNKKLDTWYFCVTDGRRIGSDLFLYKDMQNRITCTKQELKNRIGEGGRVMETQGEYIQCVNRLLFGFETIEEYQEMLDLLIQLRTPKLSKDFKPSIINEILSSSLQTLSEDDLRPMSEAIENMDSQKANLDALDESIHAAEQIEKIFDQYNQIVLYEKAEHFTNCAQECRKLEKKIKDLEQQREESIHRLEEEKTHYEELRQEEEILRQEQESLKDSDAAQLKQREIKLSGEIEEAEKENSQKKRQEQEKEERYREIEGKLKERQEQKELLWEEMQEILSGMEEALEGIPFDEYAFLKKELLEEPQKEQAFKSHDQMLTEYTKRVEKGREALLEEKSCQERYDRQLQELDAIRGRQEQKEKECRQYDLLLREVKDEWIEKFYQWEKTNEQLHLPEEIKQRTVQAIEKYAYGTDFSEIHGFGREAFENRERELKDGLFTEEQQRKLLLDQQRQILEELKEWRDKKDPEPECGEAVLRSRNLLMEKGIPFLQFYKAIDFEGHLDEKQASRLEEALLSMGILDALIVPAEYREMVESLGDGVCDRYIFSDVAHVKQNLLEVLDVDNGENDILRYQSVSNILSSIGVHRQGMPIEHGSTWVDEKGNYGIGVIEGTVTGEYQARYIGVRARERFRAEKIAQLEQEELLLRGQLEECEKRIQELDAKKALLRQEWEAFPSNVDMREAAKEYADRSHDLEQLNRQIKDAREILSGVKSELDEIQLKVRELCSKCYLTARLDIFSNALESLGNYKGLFVRLQLDHGTYLSAISVLNSLRDTLGSIDEDLDTIRYELGRSSRKKSELEAALLSIREQLKLTDYEKIKERLDYCLERLTALPGLREESMAQQAHWQAREEQLKRELGQQEENRQRNVPRYRLLEQGFRAEYTLGYVERYFVVNDDMEDQAEKVCGMLAGKFGNRKQSDLLGNLQELYHQNRGYLVNYQLTLQTLFEEEDEGGILDISMRRIDIVGKYRGVNVKFKELIGRLREDAEVQKRLLSDKERELFEDILANTISKKIRAKIHSSKRWVDNMNRLMDSMHTSSGLKLSLSWRNKRAEKEEQLDTRELVELLSKDAEIMRDEEVDKLSHHFRSKIAEARKYTGEGNSVQSFHAIMREVLDYRKWFEFTLECQKIGEKKKELTDRVFFTFSGGEKAMAMYVPLFSAVVAKYAGARQDAPRLISLDEAFAGVDETNIRDMFRLMVECRFNFMINSQVLWGDYDTVPGLAIYQLLRPENAKFVTVIQYIWNGRERVLVHGNGGI